MEKTEMLNEDIFGQIQRRDKMLGSVRKEDELTIDNIIDKMKDGICKFVYLKKDGRSVRTAYGTKNKNLYGKLPHSATAKMPFIKSEDHGGFTIYYDMEKDDWRLFMVPFLIRLEKTGMNFSEFEDDLAKDKVSNRAAKDSVESQKYKELNDQNRFGEIPFLFKDDFVYPDHYTYLSPRKKKTV